MITDLAITNEYTQDPRQLERNKDLNLMSTHFIVNYFLRLLVKFKIGNIKKIVIECAEHEITKVTNYEDNGLGVKILRRQIDINSFLKLSEIERKKWALDLLVSGFEELSNHFEFSMDEIYAIAKKIEDNNFLNHYHFGKITSSPNKQFKSVLWVEHDADKFSLFLQILDKEDAVLKKVLVKEASPSFALHSQLFGSIKWESNDTIKVLNNKKAILKTVKI